MSLRLPVFYTNKNNHLTIQIEPERDELITKGGKQVLSGGYFCEDDKDWMGQYSPQKVFARVCTELGDDAQHAQRLYDYMSNLWFMGATPILSNMGSSKNLSISCFLQHVADDRVEIGAHWGETFMLSTLGGGVGLGYSAIRSVGEMTSAGNVTPGLIPMLKVSDSLQLAAKQGKVRRGAFAAYLDISHPEIEEFIEIRKPAGESEDRKCLNLHHAVNIPDSFMEAVRDGKDWDLVDPHTKAVKKTVKARELWFKLLEMRIETGEPYIHFIDSSNRALKEHLKNQGFRITQSNLCAEILLPTDTERTAVCCLSSVNLEKYNEWKDHPTFIEDVLRFLDNNLTHFINHADRIPKAQYSAKMARDVGLGTMGLHSFLQSQGYPFESVGAQILQEEIYTNIRTKIDAANYKLGAERGEAPDMAGTGMRFSHTQAVAPNASIANICGECSPSIEPYSSNGFRQDTKNGSILIKNKHLDKLLKTKYQDQDYDSTWTSIITNEGSVQHLDWMDDWDKQVFKTAYELDQNWVVQHAAIRTPHIDQGQSVNLFFYGDADKKYINQVHFDAWKKGLKTLYYCRSTAISRPEYVGQIRERKPEESTCVACEG